jgi:hypothetical protein
MFSLRELLEEVQNNPKPPVDEEAEKKRWYKARLLFHELSAEYKKIIDEKIAKFDPIKKAMNIDDYNNLKERLELYERTDGTVYKYFFEIDGYECILRWVSNRKKDKEYAHYFIFNEILGKADIRDLLSVEVKKADDFMSLF